MVGQNLKGKDILLLLLYVPGKTGEIGESILGATRLTKAVFLFEKEVKGLLKTDIEKMPEFISWKYGPWSRDLFDYIEFFEQISFLTVAINNSENENLSDIDEDEFNKWEEGLSLDIKNADPLEVSNIYSITETGKKYVEEKIIFRLSEAQILIISEFKKKINTLSVYTILKYVYTKYGKDNSQKDWTDKSEIINQVLP